MEFLPHFFKIQFLHLVFHLFLALCCCTWGLFSSCGVQASCCGGFYCCRVWAVGWRGFSSCGTWAEFPMYVESSWTRDQTHVPCIGRQILIHCTTREVPTGTVLNTLQVLTLVILTSTPSRSCHPHWHEETVAWRGRGTCPGSQSNIWKKLGFELR